MNRSKTKIWKYGSSLLLLAILLAALILPAAACAKDGEQEPSATDTQASTDRGTDPAGTEGENEKIQAMDFTLTDQYGVQHKLSDYRGQVVFLNFWATWCPPCKQELPDIEELYKDHQLNSENLAVIGLVYPSSGSEMDMEGIRAFLDENKISFPVLMDEEGAVFRDYQVTGLPTTFLIDSNGDFIGYVQGGLSRELMDHYVDQALSDMEK